MLEPRISKREKKLQLNYELPTCIHCSAIYPIPAPNGSDVIIYGHERGIRVIWRGGRRRKQRANPPKTNGASNEVILLDSDDEGQQNQDEAPKAQDQYEDTEDDEDPDCSYPPIIQEVDLEHGSPVLSIAVPAITPAAISQLPQYAQTHIIVTQACANGGIVVTAIGLQPPTEAEKRNGSFQIDEEWLAEGGSIARSLAVRISHNQEHHHGCQILVATAGENLSLWSVAVSQRRSNPKRLLHQPRSTFKVAFPSSRSQGHLLTSERSGAVRMLDHTENRLADGRPESRGSASGPTSGNQAPGRWFMSYCTPFHSSSGGHSLARRKNILDTAWVLSARAILVLLEDGEWGVWDMRGASSGNKSPEEFALHGYLGASSSTELAEAGKQKKGGARLAPMTPNTRRTKSENLFSGPEKVQGVAPSGGISVSPINTRSGAVDESIVMWYNNEIYSITSMQTFWQRSSNPTNSASGFGSLYTPGLTHITDINLMNENITSISQFASRSTSSSTGQMNVPRDILVSTESRFIILQHQASPTAKRGLFQQVAQQPTMQDQRMLDAGELDLGGMDRLLDGMATGGRTRKVGFAN
ncbi:uncharacterized protein LTR77_003078 [Saxophila tyrrhenica]|uniref:Nucleoporin NUP37 n=1 Tax=Saxophila tyrrhenica TaxID=1690608 RepID=A0AAV9PGE4_9PEZI|nr:hypothetical protein LTR77_003078 [Saxophila tyrrhenica]